MTQEIRIPDLGDAESVEVVEILVAPGDRVEADDPVIVIESDKASMEVPAGQAGTIANISVAVGDQVVEGQVIATLAGADQAQQVPQQTLEQTPQPVAQPDGRRVSGAVEQQAARPADSVADPSSGQPAGQESRGSHGRYEVRVPDLGEAPQVVVIEIAAAVGDRVEPDDLLVVIESDKASMEIPMGATGRLVEIHVREGDEVAEGALLATIETVGGSAQNAAPAAAPVPVQPVAVQAVKDERVAVEAPRPAATATKPVQAVRGEVERPAAGESPKVVETPAAGSAQLVYAGPAVRRLARELGVVLGDVAGSGPRGRIVKEDVKQYVKNRLGARTEPAAGGTGALPQVPEIDFSRFGDIETVPLSRLRARGADNLHRSWLNIPHVTQHDDMDVTDLEAFRKTLRSEADAEGVKLTLLAFVIKACCRVLAEFPTMNASLDRDARNFILKRYFNIGIAVDTEDGLIVPVIREADRKSVWALAHEVAELSEKARNRKLSVADLQGATFSISSLGALGGTGFTPIINAPEIGILGLARLTTRPHWDGQAFVPRQFLPVSLSYDHRAVNGVEAARFVARLAELLGDIRRLIL